MSWMSKSRYFFALVCLLAVSVVADMAPDGDACHQSEAHCKLAPDTSVESQASVSLLQSTIVLKSSSDVAEGRIEKSLAVKSPPALTQPATDDPSAALLPLEKQRVCGATEMQMAEEFLCMAVRIMLHYMVGNAEQGNVSSVIDAYEAFPSSEEFSYFYREIVKGSETGAKLGFSETHFRAGPEVVELLKKKQAKSGAEFGSFLGHSALYFSPFMIETPYYTVDPMLENARDGVFKIANIQDRISNFKGTAREFLLYAAREGLRFDFLFFDEEGKEEDLQLALDLGVLLKEALIVTNSKGQDALPKLDELAKEGRLSAAQVINDRTAWCTVL